eukprot:TRINITY_DN8957_c0_g1_i1.p1 TRINITY_DN8957_c0_g1~~TRINITY_DN8957_c0_g1_i1.p1  ORF type:complete len:181 (+),score=31.00 TRINITY_DN8957_c0_g1_i1:96-638(+)
MTRAKPQYKGTKLCKFFLADACTRGQSCNFAHSEEDLKPLPDYSKTRLCKAFWRNDFCKAGAECLFAHGKEEMQKAASKKSSSRCANSKMSAYSQDLQAATSTCHPGGCPAESANLARTTPWAGQDDDPGLQAKLRQLKETARSLCPYLGVRHGFLHAAPEVLPEAQKRSHSMPPAFKIL